MRFVIEIVTINLIYNLDTAMGQSIKAQSNGDAAYVKAVYK